MIRILQCVNDMHRAGLETMLMNYYRNIDREQIQFDFLTHRPDKSDYDDEILSLGGKVYYAPRLYPQNYLQYFKYMRKFYLNHPEYKIVHSHIDSMSYLPLRMAKVMNVPIRIAHSHNTSIDRDFKYILKLLYKKLLPHVANEYFTCGKEAGDFLFPGKESTLIPNAIDVEGFKYDEKTRALKRMELGIGDEFTIGHVGRMSYQKNHEFLINVFAQVVKQDRKTKLVLIGTGEKEDDIRSLADKMKLSDHILFLGNRSDVDELYSVMDVFVLPSRFEGIPVVGIEAQYCSLPCLFSEKIPQEVCFTDLCDFISLESGYEEWANRILSKKNLNSNRNKVINFSEKYNINDAVKALEKIYLDLANQYK